MRECIATIIATEARFGAHTYEPLGVILSRDEGVGVWDAQGKRYLAFLSALAVNQDNFHPKSWPLWWNMPAPTMDNRTEAVMKSAIKCVRKWAYAVKGGAGRTSRDLRLPRQLSGTYRRYHRLQH